MMKKMFFPALLAVAAFAAACGGGGGGGLSAGGGSPVVPSQSKVAVKLVLHVPSRIGQMTPKLRQRLNEAQNTQGLNVVAYPNPQGTSTPAASQAFDVSSGSTACGTPNPDNSRTCNFSINLAPGPYVVKLGSYDATPAPGGPAGTQIGIGSSTITVTAGQANTIPVVLNGIAQSVSVTLPVPVVRAVNKLTQQATVSVLDPDNNVIVTNSYVDTNGNPVTVNLSASPVLGLITFGSSSITAPQANGVAVTYDPTNITAPELTGGVFNIMASLSSPVVSGSATLTVPQALQTVAIGSQAVGITNDGVQVWVAEPAAQALQPYAPGGGATDTLTPMPLATVSGYVGGSPKPNDVFYANDGNLYFTIQNTNAVGRIPPSGMQFLEGGVQLTANEVANSLTSDGTNVLWLESGSAGKKVGYSAESGFTSVTENAFPSPNGVEIVAGTGALSGIWWTENIASNLGYQPLAGGTVTEKSVPTFSPASNPTGIVQWNNCMWFTENTAQKIGDVCSPLNGTPSFTEIAITGSTAHPSVSPNYVVVGPDGNLWFDDATNDLIVRYDGAAFTYFPLPAGSTPGQMTVLNGTIWVVDTTNTRVFGVTP